jgi:hypothetical protein
MARHRSRGRTLPPGRIQTGKFLRLTRLCVARMREAQAHGIIKPHVTPKGWRDFDELSDVEAAIAWRRAGYPIG